MPLIFAGLALVGLFFLARKTAPGGVKPIWVPIILGDNKTLAPGTMAQWHATDDQTKLFGPRYPNYYHRDGEYFMFAKPTGAGYDFYKPDWKVPIEARWTS